MKDFLEKEKNSKEARKKDGLRFYRIFQILIFSQLF